MREAERVLDDIQLGDLVEVKAPRAGNARPERYSASADRGELGMCHVTSTGTLAGSSASERT